LAAEIIQVKSVKIDIKTVSDLAHLSRLSFNKVQSELMCVEMNKMLDFVDVLSELNTSNIEPLIFLNDANQTLREDLVVNNASQEEILINAPLHNNSFFMLPKFVVE